MTDRMADPQSNPPRPAAAGLPERAHRALPFGAGRRRTLLTLVLVAGMVAFTAAWIVPNVAGAAFVQVRAVVTAKPAVGGPMVVIGGGSAISATALDISVEIENHYPLGVVLGTGPAAYQAAAYRRDDSGKLIRVWQIGTGDAVLEEGSDSPVGGGPSDAAVVVPPGRSNHAITAAATPFRLVDVTGASLTSGVYYLRVWAYGIGSPLVPLALSGGMDPLGPPTDLPAAPA